MLDENTKTLLNIDDNIAKRLERLNINSIFDIILHIPIRYEDDTKIYPIKDVLADQTCIVKGTIIETQIKNNQLLITITDDYVNTLNIRLINFFPIQQKFLKKKETFQFKGKIRQNLLGIEMVHPIIKRKFILNNKNQLTGIYQLVSGINQYTMQSLINKSFKTIDLNETLPPDLIKILGLSTFKESITFLHNPKIQKNLEKLQEKIDFYKNRLKFDELLSQQLSMLLARQRIKSLTTKAIKVKGILQQKLINKLNFKLTVSQEKVINEIKNDLQKSIPMNRLLQGDVGSGKTIVAAIAATYVIESGLQVAIIAPTEILAQQHYLKFKKWMTDFDININYLIGKQKISEKNKIKKELIIDNKTNILIGTHAIFQKDIEFFNLGLVIIDEQHRFGVNQRLMLKNKGNNVHQLMMSATPIPRTLTMSYFADLDISIIDELPPGRQPIINKLINSKRINQIEQFIYDIYKKKQQIYWICPLIEKSEKLQLKTVNQTAEKLKKTFPDLSIGIMHGKLKSEDKITIMQDFKNNKIDILVATSVIEVGIDVPNASLMIIENAERIGLSQLHQLRGRIGRGSNKSICIFMFTEPLTEIAKKRLKIIYENNNGFEISKYDLDIRGPGEILGIKQSGNNLFKFANINTDIGLLQKSQTIANHLINNPIYIENIKKHLSRWNNNSEVINYLNV